MKITIIGFGKDMERLTCTGASGMEYAFRWNSHYGRYEYEPRTQEEIDDIFGAQDIDSLFFFSVALDGQAIATAGNAGPVPPPSIPSKQYADMDTDELRTLAADVGLVVLESDTERTLRRLLDAFFLGEGRKEKGMSTEELVDIDFSADASGSERSSEEPPDEPERIRQKLRELGVRFHPQLGLPKLRKLLREHTEQSEISAIAG